MDSVDEERDTDSLNLASFSYLQKMHGDRCTVHIPIVYLKHKVYSRTVNAK